MTGSASPPCCQVTCVKKMTALKQEDGRKIVLTGSITVAHTLIEAGLVDEYRLRLTDHPGAHPCQLWLGVVRAGRGSG